MTQNIVSPKAVIATANFYEFAIAKMKTLKKIGPMLPRVIEGIETHLSTLEARMNAALPQDNELRIIIMSKAIRTVEERQAQSKRLAQLRKQRELERQAELAELRAMGILD